MAHLDDNRIVDLITGADDRDGRRHLDGCAACGERSAGWRGMLSGLTELARESVGERELHRLRTMYRQLGPGRREGSSWVARLVRSTAPATVAARGVGTAELLEFEAGPFTVLVQITQTGDGAAAVHGQVLGDGSLGQDPGTLVLHRADGVEGVAHVQDLDDLGEFHLEPVPSGSWRATWWYGGAVIELEKLQIGGARDD